MTQKKIEEKALIVGTIMNTLMGIAGLIVYQITGIEALFIDAYYTIIALFSGLVAIFISRNSSRKTELFPNGFFILEPVYAMAKSMLSLILLTISVISVSISAYRYFAFGQGEVLDAGPIIPYTLLMVCLGLGLSVYYRRQNRKIGNASTMLLSESRNSLVDGMISAGIGVAAAVVLLIDLNSPLGFLKYTGDFFLTVTLALFVIKEPLAIIRSASIEIAGGSLKNGFTKKQIESCVQAHFKTAGIIRKCHVYKVGMSFQIHLRLDKQAEVLSLEELAAKKQSILKELKKSYEFISLDYIY